MRLAQGSLRPFVQIVPAVLGEMMADSDRAKAKRAADAMLKMVKLDIAALQAAYDGTTE
jgi:hypothetical protein